MNVIFVEPAFPYYQREFARGLAAAGAHVIGDQLNADVQAGKDVLDGDVQAGKDVTTGIVSSAPDLTGGWSRAADDAAHGNVLAVPGGSRTSRHGNLARRSAPAA